MSAEVLPPEEQARANFYALLARLFYAPPDRPLLDALAASAGLASEAQDDPMGLAWLGLSRAAAGADPAQVTEEYETAFIGTGKAPVTLYTSAYTVKTAVDNPLVDIRAFMGAQGLQRRLDRHEPEDHLAALCEVMRYLVAEQQAPIERQSDFFNAFIGGGGILLCNAIDAYPGADFYKSVGKFARAFFELERETLDMQ